VNRYNRDETAGHIEKGKNYRRLKQVDSALREFSLALKKNPCNGELHAELGETYIEKGHFALGLKMLNKAVKYGFNQDWMHRSMVKAHYASGRNDLITAETINYIKMTPDGTKPFYQNVLLNEKEISGKKIILESKPRSLMVCLTTRCNLSCIMCRPEETGDIPRKTLLEIAGYFPYLQYIQWLGGEVFLSEYFEELFDSASKYPYLHQAITTNGLLIDDNWAYKLTGNNVWLEFSIDGLTKKTYEAIRTGAKFEDLIRCLNNINRHRRLHEKNLNFVTSMNFVVMKTNYHEIAHIADFARQFRISNIVLSGVSGDLKNNENIFLKKQTSIMDNLKKIVSYSQKKTQKYGINLHNCLPIGSNDPSEINKAVYKRADDIFCFLPWQQLVLYPGHSAAPCCKVERWKDKRSLNDIWNGKQMQLFRKKMLNDGYRNICAAACTLYGRNMEYSRFII